MYGAFRREFLQEAVNGERLRPIRDFMLQHQVLQNPDEFYFNTLNYNPQFKLPGSCMISPEPPKERNLQYLAKYVIWDNYGLPCGTKYVRNVCILGEPHVETLKRVPHLFANKLHENYYPGAYDSLEEWYFNKVAAERRNGKINEKELQTFLYANRTCSRMHF